VDAASAEPDRAVAIVLDHLRAAAGAERAFLIEVAPPPRLARVLSAAAATGADGEVSMSVALRALAAERPVFWPDVRRESFWADGLSVRALALRSALAGPLPGRDRRKAAIVLDHRGPMPIDPGGAERLVRAFAGLLGLIRRGGREASRPSGEAGPTLVGRGPAFLKLVQDIESAAKVPLPTLVLGESGSGKELVARALHASGPRAGRPFIAINCAAIPESLLERELFGAVRGAFTGADRDHIGLFRQAEGGTILLDEIGDMPATLQAKLLRVLQERTVRGVGALEERPVDVRVVAATHRDLDLLVASGRFRQDLRWRLEVLVLRVPPLRERTDDLPLIAARLIDRIAARCGLPPARLDGAARARLIAHGWPGNVRELESVLCRALIRAQGGIIRGDDLDFQPASADGTAISPPDPEGLERAMIENALRETRGNMTAAAQRIGWSRQTLYRKMNALGLRGPNQAGSDGGGTRSSDSSTFQ
jgi:DNA-binding NtrC family response regulator